MADETITLTPAELSAQIAAAVKAAIPGAVNDAIKATKNEGNKGAKAAQAQLEALMGSMKPKQLKKFMKRIGAEKEPNAAKTPAEIAAEAALAAAAIKKTPTEDDLKRKTPDMYAKRVQTEFEARIAALEGTNEKLKNDATEARKSSALDRALTDFPWASIESRDMARDFYLQKVKWSEDGTELLIGDKEFSKLIATEIPQKYENLLAPAGKGGSGSIKGQGKPGVVDIDALSDLNSTPAQKAEASKSLAAMLGHQS
jgi:hypothetical protein